ncbi:hypothetical protein HID58_036999 [Brassica napus]|uniref:Uncharacterized protein n=1 Tax=Brassica napus TaxID=3708 RepID=A0ABQ8C9G0_BRANA|nr:hypothetical protein HID58_036999 [Brassica napus]
MLEVLKALLLGSVPLPPLALIFMHCVPMLGFMQLSERLRCRSLCIKTNCDHLSSDDLILLGKKGNIMRDAQKCVKKENLNRLEGNHIVYDTDKQSCEELVSTTMKLPLLSCLSPSSIHRGKEIDKIS